MSEPDQLDQMSESELREELRKVLTVCIPTLKWKRDVAVGQCDETARKLAETQGLLTLMTAEREHNGRMADEYRHQRDSLAAALEQLVEMDRRDQATDPDIIFTDEGRKRAFDSASEALNSIKP